MTTRPEGTSPGGSRLTYVLAALLGAAVVIWLVGPCDDAAARIRRRLAELVALLEKEAGEGNLEMVNRSRRIGDFFTEPFEVEIVPFGHTIRDRQQLMRTVAGFRSRARTISISIREESLEVDEPTRTAVMVLVAVVSGQTDTGPSTEAYRVKLQWSEVGGKWMLRRAGVLEALDRVPLL